MSTACKDCHFWLRRDYMGICRRFPPSGREWATTDPYEVCGEWTARQPQQAEEGGS